MRFCKTFGNAYKGRYQNVTEYYPKKAEHVRREKAIELHTDTRDTNAYDDRAHV